MKIFLYALTQFDNLLSDVFQIDRQKFPIFDEESSVDDDVPNIGPLRSIDNMRYRVIYRNEVPTEARHGRV